MSEFRTPRSARPRLARRIGASVAIMAVVLTAALALLRYGPMEIGRQAGATSVVALDAVRQHVLEPASRGVKGFVRAARERSAAGVPGGPGATNAGPAIENGAAENGAAENGAADDGGAADGTAPTFGAADATAPESDREGDVAATALEGASASDERPGESATGSERAAESGARGGADGSVGADGSDGADRSSADRSDGTDRSESDRAPPGSVAALPDDARQAASRAGAEASGPAATVAAPAPSAAASAPSAGGAAVHFTAREIVASEGQTVVPVEIARSRAGSEISVLWWTADETATAGNDYADLGGVIETFEPGQTSRTVFIPITNDSLPEGRETFVVHLALQSPDGKPRNEPQSVRVTIVDDDF